MKTLCARSKDVAKKLKLCCRAGDLDLPERRKRYWYTSSWEEDNVLVWQSNRVEMTIIVGECELYKVERDALEEEMRGKCECGMEEFCRLDNSDKTIAILGDRRWLQPVKQEPDKINQKKVVSNIRKLRNERPHVGGV